MGTGGALFKIKNKIKNDFLLVNGDTICEPPVEKLIDIVNKNKSVAGIFIKKGKFNSQKLNSLSLYTNIAIYISVYFSSALCLYLSIAPPSLYMYI